MIRNLISKILGKFKRKREWVNPLWDISRMNYIGEINELYSYGIGDVPRFLITESNNNIVFLDPTVDHLEELLANTEDEKFKKYLQGEINGF